MTKLTWEEAERRAYMAGDVEAVRIITDFHVYIRTALSDQEQQERLAYITGDIAKAKLLAAKIDNAPYIDI